MEKLENEIAKVRELRNVVLEMVCNSCHAALLDKGFIVDETLLEPEKKKGVRDKGPKTSYIEQANKKKFCYRLCW